MAASVFVAGRSKLSAAVLADAAPSWGPAMESLDKRCPLVSTALACAVRSSYEKCHRDFSESVNAQKEAAIVPPGLKECIRGGMVEFVKDHMAPTHGFENSLEGASAYMASCQPPLASNCAVPVLELLTYNDFLMTADHVQVVERFWEVSPHVVTAVTRQGTHVIRWEGLYPRCWMGKVGREFLQAALNVAAQPPSEVVDSSPAHGSKNVHFRPRLESSDSGSADDSKATRLAFQSPMRLLQRLAAFRERRRQ
mmetsp:Transcript_25254/g.84306  ORF Transcript_25254/g.84306 Transcript_25254/m.84306 type:complete len:253 (+) Transcript_25254:62-820(+)